MNSVILFHQVISIILWKLSLTKWPVTLAYKHYGATVYSQKMLLSYILKEELNGSTWYILQKK